MTGRSTPAAWSSRYVYASDWTVHLYDPIEAKPGQWRVVIRSGMGAVEAERWFPTWHEAADAYAHPFADETVPTPFARSPIATADEVDALRAESC